MSLSFITTPLFPGTSHLVPSAQCWGQSCRVRTQIFSLLFYSGGLFLSFLFGSFWGSSLFWPIFTPLCLVQQLSTSCHCYFLASCVNTVKNSVNKRGKDKFRFLGKGLKSMLVGMILSSFGANHVKRGGLHGSPPSTIEEGELSAPCHLPPLEYFNYFPQPLC